MESMIDEYMHYIEDPKTKSFVLSNIKDIREIQTRKYTIPYDTVFLFDTVMLKNVIYFTGGGCPGSETTAEQFYSICMRVSFASNMEMITDKMASMNVGRANHALIAGTRKLLFVIGGTNSKGNLSSCEEYNTESNKWREIASLNEKKKWVSACSCNEEVIYAFGGAIDAPPKASDAIESLEIAKSTVKTWEKIKIAAGKENWTFRFFTGVVSLAKDCILVFGGVVKEEEKDDSLAFNPTTNTFTKLSKLLRNDAFYRSKPGIISNKFVIVGSHEGDLHIYEKDKKKWDMIVKKIWYPEYGFSIKADTF